MYCLRHKVASGLGEGGTWNELIDKVVNDPSYKLKMVQRFKNPTDITSDEKTFSHYVMISKGRRKKLPEEFNEYMDELIEIGQVQYTTGMR